MTLQPIETAPRDGTPVFLSCVEHPEYGENLLFWDKKLKLWCGYKLTPLRLVSISWDPVCAAPTHWRPA